MKVKSIRYL